MNYSTEYLASENLDVSLTSAERVILRMISQVDQLTFSSFLLWLLVMVGTFGHAHCSIRSSVRRIHTPMPASWISMVADIPGLSPLGLSFLSGRLRSNGVLTLEDACRWLALETRERAKTDVATLSGTGFGSDERALLSRVAQADDLHSPIGFTPPPQYCARR